MEIGLEFGWLNEIGVCSPWVWVCCRGCTCHGSWICSSWVCHHGFRFCSLWICICSSWVFFFFFFFSLLCWVLLTVMLFSGGGGGNRLWSRFVFMMVAEYVVWVGFKFDG